MAEAGRAAGFRGKAFRHCAPEHAALEETLEASRRAGGRFNPTDEFGALYVSIETDTVRREFERRAERMGIPIEDLAPRILLTLRIRLGRVLDLTDADARRRWRIALSALRGEDHESCRKVARAAREQGYEAIRFPSATGSGENLAIFLDQLREGSSVEVERQEELEA